MERTTHNIAQTSNSPHDVVLVTGAAGFIGSSLVRCLLANGSGHVRAFVRPSSRVERIETLIDIYGSQRLEIVCGNLLAPDDCTEATKDVSVVYHLAAGAGEKSFADAFMNSVVTTRNLLDACLRRARFRRFVNVSSFTVYSNRGKQRRRLLDESAPVESNPAARGDAYCFAKVKQDELVAEYGRQHGLPYVIVRPGSVYGPGKTAITGRVGLDTFGVFMHLGLSNIIPLTYVDNCAEAIMLAGVAEGVEGEIFNIVDSDLPTSRAFLKLYKRNVRRFTSIPVPHSLSYGLCHLWERYSKWSQGQLPPAFSRSRWHVEWKRTLYSNAKLRERLGWSQRVPTATGLERYFAACREALGA